MDDALIGAAAEMELRITKSLNERTVNQSIYIRKKLAQTLVCRDLLILEAGVTPYVLSGLFLDTASEFCKGLNLIEWISPGECDIGKFIRLYHLQKFVYGNFPTALKVPRLRIVAAWAMMAASRAIYRCAESRAVCHCLFKYVKYSYCHLSLFTDPSLRSG